VSRSQQTQAASLRWRAAWVLAFLALAPTNRLRADPADVLIYYANETSPEGREAKNYDTLIGWLRSGDNPKHALIASQLEKDRRAFQAAVEVEIDSLSGELARMKDGPQAIVLTNRLARRGLCQIIRSDSDLREVPFPTRPTRITSSPRTPSPSRKRCTRLWHSPPRSSRRSAIASS